MHTSILFALPLALLALAKPIAEPVTTLTGGGHKTHLTTLTGGGHPTRKHKTHISTLTGADHAKRGRKTHIGTLTAADGTTDTCDDKTHVKTRTATDVPTFTATDVPTFTASDVPTFTATDVPTFTATDVPTFTASDVPTFTATDVPTYTAKDGHHKHCKVTECVHYTNDCGQTYGGCFPYCGHHVTTPSFTDPGCPSSSFGVSAFSTLTGY